MNQQVRNDFFDVPAAFPLNREDKSTPSTRLYFPVLDGLRFFAFLLVFVHHLPRSQNSILGLLHDYGWVGVHLFLFLSAYLLTSILCAERKLTGCISVKRFFIRRALRIWPLYFAYCLLTLLLAFRAMPQGVDWPRFGSLLVFVDNIASGVGGYNPIPFTSHLWTISLEEQFYLFLPFFFSILFSTSRRLIYGLFICWIAFLVLRILSVYFQAPHPFIWTAVFSADSLLLGTLFGVVGFKALSGAVARVAIPVTGIVLLFSGSFFSNIDQNGWHLVFSYSLVALGAAGLTLASLMDRAFKFLEAKSLRYLGKISYGLYVFHMIGISVGVRFSNFVDQASNWWLVALTSLVFTVLAGMISYEFFERFFIQLKHRFETIHSRPA